MTKKKEDSAFKDPLWKAFTKKYLQSLAKEPLNVSTAPQERNAVL